MLGWQCVRSARERGLKKKRVLRATANASSSPQYNAQLQPPSARPSACLSASQPACLPACVLHLRLTVLTRPAQRHRTSTTYLRRECHLLAIKLALDVVVKEVKVQHRLNDASNPHDPVAVALLRHVAPHPVEEVERPVHAHAEHVVPRQHISNLQPRRTRTPIRPEQLV